MKSALQNSVFYKRTALFGVVAFMGVAAVSSAQLPPAPGGIPALGPLPDLSAMPPKPDEKKQPASEAMSKNQPPPLVNPTILSDLPKPVPPLADLPAITPPKMVEKKPAPIKLEPPKAVTVSEPRMPPLPVPAADVPQAAPTMVPPPPPLAAQTDAKNTPPLVPPLATQTDAKTPPPLPAFSALAETSALPAPPMLSLPGGNPQKNAVNSGPPPLPGLPGLPGLPPPTALPGISVTNDAKPEPEKLKSWETQLAETYTPLETSFNYRRQRLPSTIYTTHYSDENEHLPRAVTHQDYEALLFASAVTNDVTAIRALLNAGTDINARNAEGTTPLGAARTAGARASEQLLLARGGK